MLIIIHFSPLSRAHSSTDIFVIGTVKKRALNQNKKFK